MHEAASIASLGDEVARESTASRLERWSFHAALGILCGFGIILLIAPTMVVLITSLTDSPSLKFPPTGYSLQWYAALWHELAGDRRRRHPVIQGRSHCDGLGRAAGGNGCHRSRAPNRNLGAGAGFDLHVAVDAADSGAGARVAGAVQPAGGRTLDVDADDRPHRDHHALRPAHHDRKLRSTRPADPGKRATRLGQSPCSHFEPSRCRSSLQESRQARSSHSWRHSTT